MFRISLIKKDFLVLMSKNILSQPISYSPPFTTFVRTRQTNIHTHLLLYKYIGIHMHPVILWISWFWYHSWNRAPIFQYTSGNMLMQKGTYNTVFFQLHWLPVCFKSLYKILFHTFKLLSGTPPLYLNNLIEK